MDSSMMGFNASYLINFMWQKHFSMIERFLENQSKIFFIFYIYFIYILYFIKSFL